MDEIVRVQQQGIVDGDVVVDYSKSHELLTESESLKGRIIVLGNPGSKSAIIAAREVIEELEADPQVEKDFFGNSRTRRVGLLGGLTHLSVHFLATSMGPREDPWGFYPNTESYFDYRQRIRDEEVYRQTRRPPKKAACSARRRGRKFKG